MVMYKNSHKISVTKYNAKDIFHTTWLTAVLTINQGFRPLFSQYCDFSKKALVDPLHSIKC